METLIFAYSCLTTKAVLIKPSPDYLYKPRFIAEKHQAQGPSTGSSHPPEPGPEVWKSHRGRPGKPQPRGCQLHTPAPNAGGRPRTSARKERRSLEKPRNAVSDYHSLVTSDKRNIEAPTVASGSLHSETRVPGLTFSISSDKKACAPGSLGFPCVTTPGA